MEKACTDALKGGGSNFLTRERERKKGETLSAKGREKREGGSKERGGLELGAPTRRGRSGESGRGRREEKRGGGTNP